MKDRVHETAVSLSEGETSYICIHGANISVLLASFATTHGFTFGAWSHQWTLFLSKCQEFLITPAWIQRFPGLKTISNMHHSTLFLSEVFNYLQKHHHLCCNNQKDEKALPSCSEIICEQEMASQKILALKKVGRLQNFFWSCKGF